MCEYLNHVERTLHSTRHWTCRTHVLFRVLHGAVLECFQESGLGPGNRVLDYGCGAMPYESVLAERGCEVTGADFPGNPRATVTAGPRGQLAPGLSGEFDAILSTQVLEHVSDPAFYLNEARRVLKPKGLLLLTTHGHYRYHADPTDYWRWTHEGLKVQLSRAGFDVIRLRGIFSPTQAALQMLQDSTMGKLPRGIRGLYVALVQLVISILGRLQAAPREDALLYIVTAIRREHDPDGFAGLSAGVDTNALANA